MAGSHWRWTGVPADEPGGIGDFSALSYIGLGRTVHLSYLPSVGGKPKRLVSGLQGFIAHPESSHSGG